MPALRRSLLVLALIPACLLLGPAGCSPSAPAEPAQIKGMSPADYRESNERVIATPPRKARR